MSNTVTLRAPGQLVYVRAPRLRKESPVVVVRGTIQVSLVNIGGQYYTIGEQQYSEARVFDTADEAFAATIL